MASKGIEPPAGTAGSVRALRLLLAACMVVPLLLFALIAWNSHALTVAETERGIRKTTLVLHEHALKVFETLEGTLDRIDERLDGVDWATIAESRDVHEMLRAFDSSMPQLGSLALVDPQGRIVASSRRYPAVSVDVSDREYIRALRNGDGAYTVSEAIHGRISGDPQFNIARRRSGGDGDFNGAIVAAVFPQYFVDFYRRVALGDDESMGLTRADGAVLVRYPEPAADAPVRLARGRGMMAAIERNPDEGLFRVHGQVDGIDRIFGYKKLEGHPVYVTYAVATSAVTAAWLRTTAIYAVFALPAMLALVLVARAALRRARGEAATVRMWADEVRRSAELEAALRQSQKMEALGQLTGGVAHDFNNLLTAARTNLHLLARHVPAPAATYHEGVTAALERAAKLTRQLLAFSRQEAVNPEVIDLNGHLRAMADLLERSVRADITLAWEVGDQPVYVEVDPVQLELAVLNLVVNARDAMAAGGRITIATGVDGAHAVVSVRDTGSGMPADVRTRAFEPFFTTKRDGQGTGLGLSMVYGFARQSGGMAEIDSRLGQGTCVRITLPLTTRRPSEVTTRPQAEDPVTRSIRVLLVEDNALVLLATVEGLKQEGFEVATAEHGVAALEILEGGAEIDVVVSDVIMPYGVSGFDLARRVRERWPDIPVLLTSGYSPESLATMGAEADAAVLPKPYTPDRLAARIRDLAVRVRAT
ncbi:hybrid sensor histidine kinase/response regulator [Azospirillum halopraeferens]|uniref:hybrid sensor histidine kinase/response regulator n=1 Tax=Azospirillum halopraeferens TaxID=34010 RepID=UPI00042A7FAC|nr:hybrid sensor histidine kinase/response regulator [Azospirillum halopraeferens]